jgi:chromosome segregation protein
MKLTRLRLTGFKTFVEPTDVPIEPGLTGVVGPNGCGKSNLVEALRWVMGENSYKNLRGSAMEDVIFAGSGSRPARNMAEVALAIDNSERLAPAAFNDADRLDITRRIERDEGSTYRINGKEVRARDVQILFADAATGARSPAMVRQGQISEIISAKPQARRRLLEDAAGVAGLHARRHEAELRLKAAEDNLVRLEDVLREIAAQIDSLGRQAKQAVRYRGLAAEIRKAEAMLALIARKEAAEAAALTERALEAAIRDLADATRRQGEAVRLQAIAASIVPGRREAEVAAAAALARLQRGLDEIEAEDRRRTQRMEEIARRLAELEVDRQRAEQSSGDAEGSLARLAAERQALAAQGAGADEALQGARAALDAAEARLAAREKAVGEMQSRRADLAARADAARRAEAEARARLARLSAERARLQDDLSAIDAASTRQGGGVDEAKAGLAAAQETLKSADQEAQAARSALAEAREAAEKARAPLAEAERAAQRLETEIRTLQKLLAVNTGDLWPRMIDAVVAQKGYETALGAALGEDLDASTNASAPAHWADAGDGAGDDPLPAGVATLADHVRAPGQLMRRLRQIGVVSRGEGPALQRALRPGQRLVSREGDVWRWDGFAAAAEAPSAAARRLAEKNRLGDLEREAQGAQTAVIDAREAAEATRAAVTQAAQRESASLAALAQARRAADSARETLAQAERRYGETESRKAALASALERLAVSAAEADEALAQASGALANVADTSGLDAELNAARASLAEERAAAAEARAALQGVQREAEMRARRLEAIDTESRQWQARLEAAGAGLAEIAARRAAAEEEQARLAAMPDEFLVRRRALLAEIAAADAARKAAADALAEAENALALADRAAREALDGLSLARETRAAAEARAEAARQRVADVAHAIAEQFESHADELQALAAETDGQKGALSVPEIERRLAGLKAERERLGAVNLRADQELAEASAKHDGLVAERDDLTEAIRKLRAAIGALNREGRERLLAAFDAVNGHFQRLFTVLFGGGEAELSLVESDDPLESGLEIIARPPGKKPQVITLLSGGEQALTAIALIFAVFLTNPSPICVLDEVDAPLDDANVERYCDLLRNMVAETETRFLVITHNPITMARMDRLFGVTMAERGVSQLVSVDLETAERLREAS